MCMLPLQCGSEGEDRVAACVWCARLLQCNLCVFADHRLALPWLHVHRLVGTG
jgi:hypothetical protein